jgi:hypothetical protein
MMDHVDNCYFQFLGDSTKKRRRVPRPRRPSSKPRANGAAAAPALAFSPEEAGRKRQRAVCLSGGRRRSRGVIIRLMYASHQQPGTNTCAGGRGMRRSYKGWMNDDRRDQTRRALGLMKSGCGRGFYDAGVVIKRSGRGDWEPSPDVQRLRGINRAAF